MLQVQLQARARAAPSMTTGRTPLRARAVGNSQRRLPSSAARAAPPQNATGAAAAPSASQKRSADLVRVARDFYAALYDYDLPVDAYVRQDVTLEDDALQVALSGAEAVGGYCRWLHAGVDGGEPSTTATVDGAPLEKAVLAGVEVVLADEIEAAAKRAGMTAPIHAHPGEREDVVIATWVGRFADGGADGAEVLGREEFFFAEADSSTDPLIVRIHTARTSAK
jgi:hypothetical protein